MRISTYDPVDRDAMVNVGDDGDYVAVEHFVRLVKAMADIDEAWYSHTMSNEERENEVTRVMCEHRDFVQANMIHPVLQKKESSHDDKESQNAGEGQR